MNFWDMKTYEIVFGSEYFRVPKLETLDDLLLSSPGKVLEIRNFPRHFVFVSDGQEIYAGFLKDGLYHPDPLKRELFEQTKVRNYNWFWLHECDGYPYKTFMHCLKRLQTGVRYKIRTKKRRKGKETEVELSKCVFNNYLLTTMKRRTVRMPLGGWEIQGYTDIYILDFKDALRF